MFVLGTPSFVEELKGFGVQVTEEAEAGCDLCSCWFDDTLRYEKLEKACKLLFREEVDFLEPIRI